MLLIKKIRELANLNPWQMHKKMKRRSIQSYLSLEREGKRVSLQDLCLLYDVYSEYNCGGLEQFFELIRKCSKK